MILNSLLNPVLKLLSYVSIPNPGNFSLSIQNVCYSQAYKKYIKRHHTAFMILSNGLFKNVVSSYRNQEQGPLDEIFLA